MLDVVIDNPSLFSGDTAVLAYVITAVIIVCAVFITIKLINKKKEVE